MNENVTARLALLWLLYEHVAAMQPSLSRFLALWVCARGTGSPKDVRTMFTLNDNGPGEIRLQWDQTTTNNGSVALRGYGQLKEWLDTQLNTILFDDDKDDYFWELMPRLCSNVWDARSVNKYTQDLAPGHPEV